MVCTSAGPTSPPRTSRSSPAHLAGIPHPVRLDSWRTARLRLSYRKNLIACFLKKRPFETVAEVARRRDTRGRTSRINPIPLEHDPERKRSQQPSDVGEREVYRVIGKRTDFERNPRRVAGRMSPRCVPIERVMDVDAEVQEPVRFEHSSELSDDVPRFFGVVDDIVAKDDVERGGRKRQALSRCRTRHRPALDVRKEVEVVHGQRIDAHAQAPGVEVVEVVEVVEIENQARTTAADLEKPGSNRDFPRLLEPLAHLLGRPFSPLNDTGLEPSYGPEGLRLCLLIQELTTKSAPCLGVPGSHAPAA